MKVLTGVVDGFCDLLFFNFFFVFLDFLRGIDLGGCSTGYIVGDNVLGEYLVPYNIKHHSCKEDRPKAHQFVSGNRLLVNYITFILMINLKIFCSNIYTV